jgi:2'-hydroxyisoflavone reductase
VLAPGDPNAHVQFIDVRDLALWIVQGAERRLSGVFNATGPAEPTTMRALLETLREVTESNARFTWVPDDILVEQEVRPYSEMPFWLPRSLGVAPVPVARAHAEGLVHRPIAETARDTWTWLQNGWDAEARIRENRRFRIPGGMSEEREQQILRAARRARTL